MQNRLSDGLRFAIEQYFKSHSGLITLSEAVSYVKFETRTELPPKPIADAIARAAIAEGRSIHFDHQPQEAARRGGGSVPRMAADQ